MPTFHLWRRALKVSPTVVGTENQVQRRGGMEIVAAQQTYVFLLAKIDKVSPLLQDATDDAV